MIPSTTQSARIQSVRLRHIILTLVAGLLVGLAACSSDKPTGSQKRIQIKVGEIREISVSRQGDSSFQLIGVSDNQEVVEVSRPDMAPAVDTLKKANAGPAIFQLKGITIGTANVVFSEKQASDAGNGQVKKTYVVQVVSN